MPSLDFLNSVVNNKQSPRRCLIVIRHNRAPAVMSLPVIRALTDCANFEKTVVPYIPQFYDIFQQILESITNPQALKILYVSTNPLITAFSISLLVSPIFLVAAEINRNYSQVDRFWSLLPTLYNAHFVLYAHLLGLPTARLDAVLMASVIWSVCVLSAILSIPC